MQDTTRKPHVHVRRTTRVEREVNEYLDDVEFLAEYIVISRPQEGWSRFRPAIRH